MNIGNISNVGDSIANGSQTDSIFLRFIYNLPQFVSLFFLAVAALLVVPVTRQFYRLRHFQGPPSAAWSKLWVLRTVTSGRMHRILYETTKRYGMMFSIWSICQANWSTRFGCSNCSQLTHDFWCHTMETYLCCPQSLRTRRLVQGHEVRAR